MCLLNLRALTQFENFVFYVLIFSVFWLFSAELNSHYTLPKLFAVTICTGLLLPAYLYRIWRGSTNVLPGSLWISLVALTLWWIFNTKHAIHLQTALEGQYGRYNGLYANLVWLILFVLVAQIPVTLNRTKKILNAVYIASVPVCLYAFFQYWGFDPIYEKNFSRPISSIGNAVTLGGILLLVVPFALTDFLKTETANKKIQLFILLSFLLWAALLTGSRGPWLGIVVAITIVLVANQTHFTGIRRWANRYTITLFFLSCVAVVAVVNWSLLLERLSLGSGFRMRLIYFSAAWEMIKDHPVFGSGFESFRLVYPGYRPMVDASYGMNSMPTMVHNDFLQIATDNGLPAFFLFLALVLISLLVIIKAAKDKSDASGFLIATVAAIAGFLTQGLVGWPEVSSSTMFWLFLGMGVSVTVTGNKQKVKHPVKWLGMSVASVCLVFVVYYSYTLYRVLRSDYTFRSIQTYEINELHDKADQAITVLNQLTGHNAYYQDQIGLVYLKRLIARPNRNDYDKAYYNLQKARSLNPFDPYIRIHLMKNDTIAMRHDVVEGPSRETQEDIEELPKMDPNNPTVYKTRAALFDVMGNRDEQMSDVLKAKSILRNPQ